MDELRERSGSVSSKDPLVSVLYSLIRDGDVSPSRIEFLVQEHIDSGADEVLYTNGYLAQYCIDIAERLK
jgi:hypothetical protein